MSNFTGRAIEEPKTAAAHRAWQLLSIFQQAEEGWLLLVDALAEGYSSAWNRQTSVLGDIKAKIQADRDRACFILSILTAGVGGGLLGGIASGAVRNMADKTFLRSFSKNFITNAASDGASQFGGSAVSYFQSHGNNPFSSPGVEPSTYSATMQKNVRLFFAGLHDHVADIVDDLDSGQAPAQDGEQWYQHYRNLPCIKSFPSAGDVNGHDFVKEASLCLWIAWGAERDIPYWNKAWKSLDNPPMMAGAYFAATNTDALMYRSYLNDAANWDPILDEIRALDPSLEMRIKRSIAVKDFSGLERKQTHIDLRTLKTLGIYSRIRSAQVMSGYLSVLQPMTPDGAKNLMLTMNDLPKMN